MRRFIVCLLLLTVLVPVAAAAQGSEPQDGIAAPEISPLSQPLEEVPIQVSAPSVLLVEAHSGRVIFEKNADERRQVASVTKLMTLLLVLEAIEDGRLSLDDTVEASREAASMGGSQALLDVGGVYRVEDLLKSVIVASANDAAVALAEELYGSEAAFVRRMNERAAALGLEDTHYENCTGLTAEGMYTTARDVAQISRLVAEKELYYKYSGIWLDEILHKNNRRTELANTNRLIRSYQGADGLKTGSTSEAKFCVSATATRDDMRLIAVVLGAPSSNERFSDAAKMLDYGFAHYYLMDLFTAGEVIQQELPVKGGSPSKVDAVAQGDVRAMIMKGEEDMVSCEVILPEFAQAPLEKGDPIGEIIVRVGTQVVAREPIAVAEDLSAQGFWGGILRILDQWL